MIHYSTTGEFILVEWISVLGLYWNVTMAQCSPLTSLDHLQYWPVIYLMDLVIINNNNVWKIIIK